MLVRIIFILLLGFFYTQAWAQQCDTSRPLSTPSENFFFNKDGTITELATGLTWMRCAFGQRWNGDSCEGNAFALTWQETFTKEGVINKTRYAGLSNWRVPKLSELATIVERQCSSPRINSDVFPQTPSNKFWTSSSKKTSPLEAFALDFNDTGLQVVNKNHKLLLRLVSGRH